MNQKKNSHVIIGRLIRKKLCTIFLGYNYDTELTRLTLRCFIYHIDAKFKFKKNKNISNTNAS